MRPDAPRIPIRAASPKRLRHCRLFINRAAKRGGPYGSVSIGYRGIRWCHGPPWGPPPTAAHRHTQRFPHNFLLSPSEQFIRTGRTPGRPAKRIPIPPPQKVAAPPRIPFSGRQERRPLQLMGRLSDNSLGRRGRRPLRRCGVAVQKFDTRAGRVSGPYGIVVRKNI